MAKNWIADATRNKGGLHRSLGIKQSEKIPVDMIQRAAKGSDKAAKQARLALTLRHLHG